MEYKIDLVGHVYGFLTVKEFVRTDEKGRKLWKCLCECGNEQVLPSGTFRSGNTKSCGCFGQESRGKSTLKHGHAAKRSKEYTTWVSMIDRCERVSSPAYKNYGGRRITICQRWREDFANFYADMGPKPPNMSIDRIDNDGNYEPGNCKWATCLEQTHNRRVKTHCKRGHLLSGNNCAIYDGCRSCKTCSADLQRKRIQENRRKYAKRQADWKAANPEKSAAHLKVASSIRSGKLKRQPCEVCRNPKAIAHHEDYNKPLEVNWLCRPHHQKRHHQIGILWEQWFREAAK